MPLVLTEVFANNAHSDNNRVIKLQLKWLHQFQFAGYYMALEKGYYADSGLDVEIRQAGKGVNPIEALLKGEVDYAVSGSDALIAKSQGKPVVALAAISNESPLSLLVRRDSGIKNAQDLRGKKIMLNETDGFAIAAMLEKAKLAPGDYIAQPTSFNIRDLINKNTDAFTAYVTNEGYYLDRLGIDYLHIRPSDYGLRFYNDVLLTTEQEISAHPLYTHEFLKASLKGWKYAFSHIDETIDLILEKYNTQNKSREHLEFEAKKMAELIRPLQATIGEMQQEYWSLILDKFVEHGKIKDATKINFDEFIYTKKTYRYLDRLNLTFAEKSWLLRHQNEIRLGVNNDWFPIEFSNKDGELSGISADLIKLIGQHLRLNIKSAQGMTQAESINKLKNKQVDVLPAAIKDSEKEGYSLFSNPYMQSNWAIVTTQTHAPIQSKSLINGQTNYSLESLSSEKVAVTKGYLSHQRLSKRWPMIETVVKPTILETLQSVLEGEASAAIVDLETATPLMHSYQMTNLRVDDFAFEDVDFIRFAVRKDWPELVSIINKEIDIIGQTEIDRIKNKWRSVPVTLGIQKESVILILSATLIIVLLIILWAVSLKKAKRKIELISQQKTDLLVSKSRHIVMGEMISMLAHQWKQPLTSMMLAMSIVKQKISNLNTAEDEADFLNKQLNKVDKMLDDQNKLIFDLRNFFHPDKKRESFNLSTTINSSIDILSGALDKNTIKIDQHLADDIQIYGFERELRHVLINIIKNAIDELIESNTKHPTIVITATIIESSISIKVQDNGKGISKSAFNSIFDAYTSTKALNGTGLGLYMSKMVIEEHFKGSLSVSNCGLSYPCIDTSNTGACFVITFPLRK